MPSVPLGSTDQPAQARAIALEALLRGGTQAALDHVLGERADQEKVSLVSSRERALATQLTYGTVKMRRALAWSIQHYLHKPLDALEPTLQNVLLLGAYQLLYLKKIPAHSAVDESVRLARRHGHSGTAAVANAVLRRLSAEPIRPPPPQDESQIEAFANFASVPNWLAQHWIERFGFSTALRVAQGVNAPARRAIRVNLARVSVAALGAELAAKNVTLTHSRYGIPECLVFAERAIAAGSRLAPALRLGLLTVQSEESLLAVHALDPQPSETIIDACAGRGVKAGAIAQRLASAATNLYALDDDAAKLTLLAREFERLGFKLPHLICCDARRPYPAAVPRGADAVLVDAPCSGIGTVGRRAELRWSKHASDAARLHATQLTILNQAASAVRNGGRLLYTVCSTAVQENESVVDAFLTANSQWRATPLRLQAPSQSVLTLRNYALTIPGIEGADGFFYASLIRHGTKA